MRSVDNAPIDAQLRCGTPIHGHLLLSCTAQTCLSSIGCPLI